MTMFEDMYKTFALCINPDVGHIKHITDKCFELFEDLSSKQGRRAVYRLPVNDEESVTLSISDVFDSLELKASDYIDLDFVFTWRVFCKQSSGLCEPLRADRLSAALKGGPETLKNYISKIDYQSKNTLEYSIGKVPYLLPGLVARNGRVTASIDIHAAYLKSVSTDDVAMDVRHALKGIANDSKTASGEHDSQYDIKPVSKEMEQGDCLRINIRVNVNNINSQFMKSGS